MGILDGLVCANYILRDCSKVVVFVVKVVVVVIVVFKVVVVDGLDCGTALNVVVVVALLLLLMSNYGKGNWQPTCLWHQLGFGCNLN